MAQARDPRRAFTQTQKNEILYQQNNRCAKCHDPLDPRAKHFHHIKGWAAGGRTVTVNGAALCPTCHAKTEHNERLNKVDRTSKTIKAKTRKSSPAQKKKKRTRSIWDISFDEM
jgi:recombinational DNA repair protein (RecF pathway)